MADSYWEDRFRKHEVWRWIEQFKYLLHDLTPIAFDSVTSASVERIRALVGQLESTRDRKVIGYDSRLLDELDSQLAQIASGFQNYEGTKNSGYLQSAAEDPAGRAFAILNSLVPSRDRVTQGTIRAARELLDETSARIQSMRHEMEKIGATVGSITDGMDEQNRRLDLGLDDASRRIANAETSLAAQAMRTDSALNDLTTTFAQDQKARQAEFDKQLAGMAKRVAALTEELDEKSQRELDLSRERAEIVVKGLYELELEAQNVVSAVGQNATATHYGQYAFEQAKAADNWRRLSIWSFIGSSVIAFALVVVLPFFNIHLADEANSWQLVLIKFAVSIGLLALGAYAARESSNHRFEERRAKSIQLDLAALDPFMANEEKDSRAAIKLKAARRLFVDGGPSRVRSKREADQLPPPRNDDDDQLKVLTKLADAILTTVKKLP